MLKTFRFMLLAAFTMVCGNIFAQEETTVTWEAASGDALTTIYPDANISLMWEEAGGAIGTPKYVNGSVYFDNGNRVTVAGRSNDVKIKKIVFTFSSGSASLVTCNASGNNESSYGITNSSADMTSTWEGETNSLIFRASQRTGVRYISSIAVTYTGGTTGPVETAPVLNITSTTLGNSYDMDTNGVFVVYAKNEGDAAAQNAKVTVNVDGAENTVWEIGTLAIGEEKWKNMKFDVTNIEAGEHSVTIALTADNADAFTTEAKTVNFTKKAAEATYSISANAVTVAHDAESYSVVATLTNTSETVDGANIKVELRKGISDVLATETVASLAAGANTQVTLTVNKESFETGTKTYYLYVNDKYLASVDVTFEEAPVVETKSLEITSVDGTIKLGEESNTLRIIVQNTGNVDITDAAVVLKNGETTLGQGTISATAGQQGWANIAVDKTGLEAGTITVTAIVTLDAENKVEKTAQITVEAASVPQATYTVTAQDVTVAFGAQSFVITATVKNTSEVEAKNIVVKLTQNIQNVVDPVTIETLAAGAEQTVTFTVAGPFTAGTTATYYVQVGDEFLANKAQQEVTVTFEAEEEQVVDIALIDIRGLENINLKNETNAVQVWFTNNSTVDNLNATITLTMNGTEVATEAIAKGEQYKSFTLPTEGLVAGETAALVATLNVEDNKEGNVAEVTKTLDIVSGEVAPAAEIAINPISGFEVEAGEQTVSVGVTLFNNGEVEAKNVKVELYKSYGDGLCEAQTVDVPAGEENNFKMLTFTFNYTFEAGKSYEFTAYTGYVDANTENNMQKFTLTCPAPVADVAVAKIADIEATTADEVKIVATVQNKSDIKAENVLVALYQGMEKVGETKKVDEIEANGEAQVEFNLGTLAAGTYNYNVMITSTDANANNNMQSVTVKVSEPVVETVEVELTQVNLTNGHIDLAETNVLSVWVENKGNVDADATINVTLNGTALEAQAVNVKAGKNGSAQFTLNTEGLVAGEKATVVATVTVENNTSETISETKEYDIVDSSVATEPVFEIAAQNVEVEFGAEKFTVIATVKNVSGIAAENVEVNLFYNEVIATQTVEAIAANGEAVVTFADVENPFTKAGEYTMYVQAPKATAEVKVTVKPEPVAETIDVALLQVNLTNGHIDLAETNVLSVWVENKGNVDADATINVTLNGTALEAQAVNVKAGKNGSAQFTLNTEGLVAGEKATVVAAVTVEGNTAETISETKEYDIVDSSVATEPVFAVTAENVTVEYGATSFEIKATVKNTSEVTANGLTVKLLKGITEVEEKTLNVTLAAGEETEITFTIAATDEAPFVAGQTATYYVQAPKAQAEVTVTFAEAPVDELIDLAVTAIQGTLSLDTETNYLTVFVENKGNVDVENATLQLAYGVKSTTIPNVSVKAGNSTFKTFEVPAADLTAGEFTVTATVDIFAIVDGVLKSLDADNSNNKFEKTYTIAAPAAVLSFTVAEVTAKKDAASFNVEVTVANTGKGAAENMEVKVYDENSTLLGEATIASIAVGAEETATITVNKTYTEVGTFKNQLQVWVAGVEDVKWVDVTVIDGGTTAIAAVKAVYGENVQIFNLAGKKVNDVRKGEVYIINGKKTVIK